MLALSYASSVSPYFYEVRSTVTTAVKSLMKVRTLGNTIVAAEPGFFFDEAFAKILSGAANSANGHEDQYFQKYQPSLTSQTRVHNVRTSIISHKVINCKFMTGISAVKQAGGQPSLANIS